MNTSKNYNINNNTHKINVVKTVSIVMKIVKSSNKILSIIMNQKTVQIILLMVILKNQNNQKDHGKFIKQFQDGQQLKDQVLKFKIMLLVLHTQETN